MRPSTIPLPERAGQPCSCWKQELARGEDLVLVGKEMCEGRDVVVFVHRELRLCPYYRPVRGGG